MYCNCKHLLVIQFGDGVLLLDVFSKNGSRVALMVQPTVNHPDQCVVHAEVKPQQNEESTWHCSLKHENLSFRIRSWKLLKFKPLKMVNKQYLF